MKKILSFLLAAVITASTIAFVQAGSTNKMGSSKPVEVLPNSVITTETGEYQSIVIQPRNGVESGDSIVLNIENGKFIRQFVESDKINLSEVGNIKGIEDGIDNPFIFRAENGGETYDQILQNRQKKDYDTIKYYVGDRGSRELPYGFKWWNEDELEVKLFPIPDNYVNQNNNDITIGTPIYNIKLPVAAYKYAGDVVITIDDNASSITGGQKFVICNVIEDETETSTETTTEITTEASSETTTTAIRPSSGGGGGGGGGSSSSRITTTTTESTTEETTEAEYTEETTDEAEEITSEPKGITEEIKVQIGSNTVMIGDESFTMDAAAYIQPESNSTLVPLRFVAIAILGEDIENADSSHIISWNSNTKTAAISVYNLTVSFTAGSDIMKENTDERIMENGVKAEIKDGRMYIPFRALGEALGADVDWDGDTKTAIFKSKWY